MAKEGVKPAAVPTEELALAEGGAAGMVVS